MFGFVKESQDLARSGEAVVVRSDPFRDVRERYGVFWWGKIRMGKVRLSR